MPADQQIGGYPQPGQLSSIVDEATLDSEGRCVILEFPAFVLLGVYSPANRDETRDEFRLGFLEALDARVRNLIACGKQVILAGDLNVVRSEMDSNAISDGLRKTGISIDEWASMPSRQLFNNLIYSEQLSANGSQQHGRVLWDLCRYFHPDREGMNTCWDTKKNTRPANYGSRIDYVLCSDGLKDWFTHADIQEGLMGSDHCPVYAVTAKKVPIDASQAHILDVMNPPDMFRNGERRREWNHKDLLPLSAKLIPEFDRRQSIRDMFTRQTSSTNLIPNGLEQIHSSQPAIIDTTNSTTRQSAHIPVTPEIITAKPELPASTPQPSLTSKRILTSPNEKSVAKRNKLSPEAGGNTKSKKGPNQTTLRGFFMPKDVSTRTSNSCVENDNQVSNPPRTNIEASCALEELKPASPGSTLQNHSKEIAPFSVTGEAVFDPIQAKESWSKLLGKRIVPRCEHNEPCISLVTKKAGINCGIYSLLGTLRRLSSPNCPLIHVSK